MYDRINAKGEIINACKYESELQCCMDYECVPCPCFKEMSEGKLLKGEHTEEIEESNDGAVLMEKTGCNNVEELADKILNDAGLTFHAVLTYCCILFNNSPKTVLNSVEQKNLINSLKAKEN